MMHTGCYGENPDTSCKDGRRQQMRCRTTHRNPPPSVAILCTAQEDIMAENNGNQKSNRGNNRNRKKGNRSRSRGELTFNKGELVQLAFQRRPDGTVVSCVGLNDLGIDVFSQSLRFRPIITNPSSQEAHYHYCSVQRFNGRHGEYGLALPVWPFREDVNVWIPTERLSEVFVAELTFRKGRSRMIANHRGSTVVLERGYEVPLEKKVRCRLEEHGGNVYAIPLMLAESDAGNAMVHLKDAFDKAGFTNSRFVVVDDIKTKPGVAQVTCEDDVVVTQKYMDVYEILSNARLGITVDASSTEQEIKAAFRKQVSKVHPDTTLRSYKDRGVEPPVLMRMLAEGAHKRLTDAYDRAVALLEPKAPAEAEDTKKGDVEKADEAKATPAKVTKKKATRKKVAKKTASKKTTTKKVASKKAAAKAAGDAPASPEVSADATSDEVSTPEPAKTPKGEPESRVERFNKKYADTAAKAAGASTTPKSKTPAKQATEDKGSFQDQLASARANLGPAK